MKSSPDFTFLPPDKFLRKEETQFLHFSKFSSYIDIHPRPRTERQQCLPSLRIGFDRFKNVFVENAVFSIDIEPRVILLVYWEASTTC